MKVKHTRKKFDSTKGLICIKPFLYDGKQIKPGNIFRVNTKDKKKVTRARQLYEQRKLDYKDDYKKSDIDAIKKAFTGNLKKEKLTRPSTMN